MEIDFSFLANFSNAILILLTLIVWNKIRAISGSLDIPDAKKKTISILSFLMLFGWLSLSFILSSLDAYHVSPEIISIGVPLGFILPIIIGRHLMNNSITFQKILDKTPNEWLILIQIYRVVGVVFLFLLAQGLLPSLFAIPSGFGDIIVGFSAPIVAFFYIKKKSFSGQLAKLWNYAGILDLAVAIGIGVLLAIPKPFSIISTVPTTEIMTIYPMVLVPVFAVPMGMLLHMASLKKLSKKTF